MMRLWLPSHGRERWTDSELATKVIRHQEGVVTDCFGTLGTSTQLARSGSV
jgi:hypothetical protein